MAPVPRCPNCKKTLFVKCVKGHGCPCQGSQEKVDKMLTARSLLKNKPYHELIQYHMSKIGYTAEHTFQQRIDHRHAIKRLLSRSKFGRSIIDLYERGKKEYKYKGFHPTIEMVYESMENESKNLGVLDEFYKGVNKVERVNKKRKFY